MSETIKDGVVVSTIYTLTVDGEVIEFATLEDPLEYLHGAENILPALEQALTGKTIGDKISLTLTPEEGYGEYDEDEIDEVDRDELPDEVEVGMDLLMEDEFGNFFEARVKEINDDVVVLDFNSTLAGKTVHYEIEVIGIRPAESDELDAGYPLSEFDDDEFDDDDYD